MIQKRYQYFGQNGIEWTEWFDFEKDDSNFDKLNEDYKWQFKNKLLNEFRIV